MPLIGLALLLIGIVLWVLALRHRSPEAPSMGSLSTYHPRHWKPIWKQRSWFSPQGYRYYLVGTTFIVVGGLFGAIFVFR